MIVFIFPGASFFKKNYFIDLVCGLMIRGQSSSLLLGDKGSSPLTEAWLSYFNFLFSQYVRNQHRCLTLMPLLILCYIYLTIVGPVF